MKHYIHLSIAQHDLLIEFRDGHAERPTFKQYEAFQKRMKVVDPKGRLKPKDIPNTIRGFEQNEVKLKPDFNSMNDLPVGWAVYSRFDSGSNFGITSAGQHVLTALWNGWNSSMPNGLALLHPFSLF